MKGDLSVNKCTKRRKQTCLKIDPELPQLVRKTFSEKLQGNITIRDLQEEIFTALPQLIQSLDGNERRETVIKHKVNGEILQDQTNIKVRKKYFMIDQQIAWHFVHLSQCFSNPLSLLCNSNY